MRRLPGRAAALFPHEDELRRRDRQGALVWRCSAAVARTIAGEGRAADGERSDVFDAAAVAVVRVLPVKLPSVTSSVPRSSR